MLTEFTISTPQEGCIDITSHVMKILKQSQGKNSLCQVFVPHTTAGITLNKNSDPDVMRDMMLALQHIVPELDYRYSEGNCRAHIKASLLGSSVTVPVVNNMLYMGIWQAVYFCEFDGPRERKVCVMLV